MLILDFISFELNPPLTDFQGPLLIADKKYILFSMATPIYRRRHSVALSITNCVVGWGNTQDVRTGREGNWDLQDFGGFLQEETKPTGSQHLVLPQSHHIPFLSLNSLSRHFFTFVLSLLAELNYLQRPSWLSAEDPALIFYQQVEILRQC